MEDKRNELIGKFNQLRLELGAIELGIDLANTSKAKIIAQLKATQTQYDQLSAQVERAKAAAGIGNDLTPAGQEPEVGLTDDAKKEMIEKLEGKENEGSVQVPSETSAA